MIPRSFEYHAPRALDEAVSLLEKLGPEAKILSGGQSLIPMMKLRLASPQTSLTSTDIPDLNYVTEADGFLRIGALARESDLENSPLIKSRYPLLADTTVMIADPLVRNQATVCGNLAHGDPANDHPATMLALGRRSSLPTRRAASARYQSRASSPDCSRPTSSPTRY